ncbi:MULTISPECIES: DNA polymerase III subunit epsilon [unclassified Neptuniibacter]|uniref:DNA polymerase III subunit epsilon n=1 Tax=unclassified Neptuniibacter TaxID=2630693 RepID=UPI000C5399B7|nr:MULTISPECIES: DNA polymerase III subunit epsilon [unclassified Neptuniibacter]MAY40815.1 DNA polymerase III subunit epsilon [Oceanospirillaceae bacterium]|tara:strand:+ start:13131 stop:13844 length:714 start_codon:yes stop_codon:yes gene_type:complete
MRQIVLDTETTGLEPSEGHNIIEIGCVEMFNRRLTGRTYHQYIKPDHAIDAEAMQVHGITNEFLEDKPKFDTIITEFVEFIRGAELIIHNAAFDIGFIDTEFERNNFAERVEHFCPVTDSLLLARKKHPGQKNNLDALCKRYGINNSHRELHGALLDSEILADVYLALTGGQTNLSLATGVDGADDGAIKRILGAGDLPIVTVPEDEQKLHDDFLKLLDKKSGGECVWLSKGETIDM